jgi:hypothetical protein
MDHHAFTAPVSGPQEGQDISSERLPRAEMVVSDRLHQNAGCAEQPLVLGLKIDRKASQLPRVEEATHSGDTLSAHEVGPFKDTEQRRVRRPRPVCSQLATPRRPEVEIRVHYPFVKSAMSGPEPD